MTRKRHLATSALAVISMLGGSIAVAQKTDQKPTKNADRQAQSSAGDQQQGDQKQIEIPQALQDLNLTSDQQQSIKQAIRSENQKLQQAWQKFNKAHYRAIELEAAWMAAVRDTLSEEQQQTFDQQRMQDRETAKHSNRKARHQNAATTRRQNRQADSSNDRTTKRNAKRDANAKDQNDSKTGQDRKRPTAADRDKSSDSQSTADRSSPAQDEPIDEFVVITVTSPELFVAGANPSDEQQQKCSKVCRDYKQQLRTAWNEMHQLHEELVQLEADRFEAIEKQLTKDQLDQLRKSRQRPTKTTASVDSKSQQNR